MKNLNEVLAQIGVTVSDLPIVRGISLRADEVGEGEAFVALKGEKCDGADFVPQAVQNGAALILSERPLNTDVPVVVVPNLKERLTAIAAALYPSDQMMKLAVTGTNGKTSTAFFVQQILNNQGIPAASIGTLGVDQGERHTDGRMTTPDAVTLNKTLNRLAESGVRVAVMEASSHGLDQGRLAHLTLEAGAFTNLTQDHLDYHKTMDAYLTAKSKLFSDVVRRGGMAVLNADDPCCERLKQVAVSKGLKILTYGHKGADLEIVSQNPTPDGQDIVLKFEEKTYPVHVGIVGDFQASNLCAAVGLCLAAGVPADDIMRHLSTLKAPAGRLERIGTLANGAQVFVDYAHTPDAVERVLTSLRAHTQGRLVCVLGCGGDRDKTKRPLMGAAADRLADVVYVTDDNPRTENPADIRRAILAACPKGIETDNREEAIHTAVHNLKAGDVLVIAGKGHEPGQTVGQTVYAMDDRVEARLAVMNETGKALWSAADLALALSVKVAKRIAVFGFSIDTRIMNMGDMFIALKVAGTDSHNRVKEAVQKGAAVCLVDHLVDEVPADKQIVVTETIEALTNLARFARMRTSATFIGVTGSSGKTTTKEMLKACLAAQGKTHATAGNYNNQIGVPLTLVTMPADTRFAVVEMGMNHTGELMHLSKIVRPDISIITSIGAAHREFFKTEEDVARAKSEIFDYQNRQGTAVLNQNCRFYDFLKQAALGQGVQHILSFGDNPEADSVLESVEPDADGMRVRAVVCKKPVDFHMNFYGRHFAEDALGVLTVVAAVGGDVGQAVQSLEQVKPAVGRGAELSLTVQGKKIRVIDDAYNANPSSMKASLLSLGLRTGGRKVAVLGDMLELGDLGPEMHADLMPAVTAAGVDRVYTVGPLMENLWNLVPESQRGKAVRTAGELIPVLKADLCDGDIILIKASHGTGLNAIIQALKGE